MNNKWVRRSTVEEDQLEANIKKHCMYISLARSKKLLQSRHLARNGIVASTPPSTMSGGNVQARVMLVMAENLRP